MKGFTDNQRKRFFLLKPNLITTSDFNVEIHSSSRTQNCLELRIIVGQKTGPSEEERALWTFSSILQRFLRSAQQECIENNACMHENSQLTRKAVTTHCIADVNELMLI
eukprot:m.208994 g.208994  ORF g.208994 m.208994 type:complete len:109 (+) comp39723_c0_seq16:2040-2366(+)